MVPASANQAENDVEPNNAMLLERAKLELEALRIESKPNSPCPLRYYADRFPQACLEILKGLPGNSACFDCGRAKPDWASVSYGTLICLQCSGRHRSLGVKVCLKPTEKLGLRV